MGVQRVEGDIVNKLYFLALIFALASGCANNAQNNPQKVRLVGVKNVALVPASGPSERIYFTSVDDRERKTIWSSYPEKLDIWPGKHIVAVVCEWRPTATAPSMGKGFRKIEDTFEAGHIYKFTSTLEQSGECSISYKDVTSANQKGSDQIEN